MECILGALMSCHWLISFKCSGLVSKLCPVHVLYDHHLSLLLSMSLLPYDRWTFKACSYVHNKDWSFSSSWCGSMIWGYMSFTLRTSSVNVKQMLMVEPKSNTSQAAYETGKQGEAELQSSNRTVVSYKIESKLLSRSFSVQCTTPLYWHANAGSASWTAWMKWTPSP